MPSVVLACYVEMLPPLTAQQQLAGWSVTQLPYMKPGTRSTVVSGWRREASKVQPKRVRKASPDDLAAVGIAVEEVSHG